MEKTFYDLTVKSDWHDYMNYFGAANDNSNVVYL